MEEQKPMLGEVSAITIATPDLEASLRFYVALGFSETMRDNFPFPWIQITDGALLMMLRKDEQPYIALTYYPSRIDPVVRALEDEGISFVSKPRSGDMIPRYVFRSPDDLNISLVEIPGGFKQPPGPTLLDMKAEDYFNPEKYVNKTCGMFGELAHPVKDLDASVAFWKKLGFRELSRFDSPYPWAILSDGLAIVGAHQTDRFQGPALTYFAFDMKEKIAALKQKGIAPDAGEGQSNVVLISPEKQHINLFRMGM